ncbi:hypothetical protein ACFQ0T_38235 [Kitasatospora gansuensis]
MKLPGKKSGPSDTDRAEAANQAELAGVSLDANDSAAGAAMIGNAWRALGGGKLAREKRDVQHLLDVPRGRGARSMGWSLSVRCRAALAAVLVVSVLGGAALPGGGGVEHFV